MASIVDTFSSTDMDLLAEVVGCDLAELRADLRCRPWAIHDLLGNPRLLDRLLDPDSPPGEVVSPMFLFSVITHRVAAELREASYVNDWQGPLQRLPVFDVDPLREFVEDTGRVFFLAGLLTSFALPERPPVPVSGPLDLTGMAIWVDQLMPVDRVKVLKRLGDLALFLTGVFPDRTGGDRLSPQVAERLGRTVDMTSDEILSLCSVADSPSGLGALESLGTRWYETALAEAGHSKEIPSVVGDVATRFSAARRVLNHLADRYLYRFETRWDPAA